MKTKAELRGQAIRFAMRIKAVAKSIESEGDDYDMKWHRRYCKQLSDASDEFINKLS